MSWHEPVGHWQLKYWRWQQPTRLRFALALSQQLLMERPQPPTLECDFWVGLAHCRTATFSAWSERSSLSPLCAALLANDAVLGAEVLIAERGKHVHLGTARDSSPRAACEALFQLCSQRFPERQYVISAFMPAATCLWSDE